MSQLVSVCMPAKNSADYVAEAIGSILSQTYENLELIVVDDGSSDNTLEVVSNLSQLDERLRWFSSPEPGVVGARREAFRRAKGSFVANMDADDIALPHRVEAQVDAMDAGLDLCGTQFDFLFGDKRRPPRKRFPLTQVEAFLQLFRSNPVSNPSIMFRRSKFGKDGLPYNPSYVPSADYELWSRLLSDPDMRFANLPDVHMLYRVHSNQVTRPQAFVNRVAAARVRLDLIASCELDLDDATIRSLCVPEKPQGVAGVRPSEPKNSIDALIDQTLRDLAARIFAQS